MKPPISCPVCTSLNKNNKLILYQINLTKAVYLCEDKSCTYPKGHNWIEISRSWKEIAKNAEKIDPIGKSGLECNDFSIDSNEFLEKMFSQFENACDTAGSAIKNEFEDDFDMEQFEKDLFSGDLFNDANDNNDVMAELDMNQVNDLNRLENDHKKSENDPKILKNERKRLENDHKRLENDCKRLENDHKRLENDRKRLENDRKRLENDRKSVENDCKRLESDPKRSENGPKRSENNLKISKNDHKRLENGHKKLENVHKNLENDRKRLENDPKRSENDSKRLENEDDNKKKVLSNTNNQKRENLKPTILNMVMLKPAQAKIQSNVCSNNNKKIRVSIRKDPGCNISQQQIQEILKKLPPSNSEHIVLNYKLSKFKKAM